MNTFEATSMDSLSQRTWYKRLLMSPLWVMAFISITAMECSGPADVVTIDQAGYRDSIRLTTDDNGHVLVGYKFELINNVVIGSDDGADLPDNADQRIEYSLNSYTYEFSSGEITHQSTIKQFDVETDFVTDFDMDMGPSGIAVASWKNKTDFYGSGYNINQPESTWLDSSQLTSAAGLSFEQSYGLDMGAGSFAMFAGKDTENNISARAFDGNSLRWTIDDIQFDTGNLEPDQVQFNFYNIASIAWVQDGSLAPQLHINQAILSTPLNETVQQLAGSATQRMRIIDAAISGEFSGDEIIVWTDGSGAVFSNYYDGQNWFQPTTIEDVDSATGSVVIDQTGSAIFVWAEGFVSVPIKVRHFSPSIGWGSEQTLGTGSKPRISMNLQGEAVVIWENNNDLHSARYSPQSGWQADGVISDNLANDDYQVIIDNNGNALAAWSYSINPEGGPVYGTRIRLHDYSRASLDVTVNGNGQVTSSPAGIDCGSDCREQYNVGSTITLTAVADSGASFIGWSGDCTAINAVSNQASVTINDNSSCTANFTQLTNVNLTLTIMGGPGAGEVNSSETPMPVMNCINSAEPTTTCIATYPRGSNVFLLPLPYGQLPTITWTGCDQVFGTEGCSLAMTGDRNVIVTFQ